jgi:hypothetical protein
MKNSPCYNNGEGCQKRTINPNCHSTCKEYNDWVLERAKCQIKNATQKAYLGYYFDIIKKNKRKRK